MGNPWVIWRVPAPTPTWTCTRAYGYGYLQVTRVPRPKTRVGSDHRFHVNRRDKEGTTPPVALIRVCWRGREGEPPCHVGFCFSTRQGGNNPPCRIDSRLSTWQGGRNPPCHIGSCFSMRQEGDNPPCHVDSRLLTWQGGRNPPCHISSHFLTRQGGRNPPSCRFVCVGSGMSNGGGKQLGKGGRELELHCNVFKFENVPFMWMGTTSVWKSGYKTGKKL